VGVMDSRAELLDDDRATSRRGTLRGAEPVGEPDVLDCVHTSMWAGRGMAGFEVEGSGVSEVPAKSFSA
jgi:hypothetical protein